MGTKEAGTNTYKSLLKCGVYLAWQDLMTKY